MEDQYIPKPEDRFTFGLWTVGNTGRDAFGTDVRESKSPADLVYLLSEVGAYGVNFHDNDLIPIDATPEEEADIKKSFKKALADTAWLSNGYRQFVLRSGFQRWCVYFQ